ncbi:MAG: adenylosuccinate lyase, partial [Lentisphaeria bacterium]|nr:adenylosuccinate lyase [Lentisphaeria bacterium]
LHEAIRVHSIASAQRVKDEGVENDLFERLAGDALFAAIHERLDTFASDPSQFIGRAPEQVKEFVAEVVDPLLAEHECAEAVAEDVSV